MIDRHDSKTTKATKPVPIDSGLLGEVQVVLEACLGTSRVSVAELSGYKSGSIVTLDQSLADYVDLRLNGSVVARGEIVAVGDRFGVRITEIASVP